MTTTADFSTMFLFTTTTLVQNMALIYLPDGNNIYHRNGKFEGIGSV